MNFFSGLSDGLPLAWSILVGMIVVFCGFGYIRLRLWLGSARVGIVQGLVGDVVVRLGIKDGVGSLLLVVD